MSTLKLEKRKSNPFVRGFSKINDFENVPKLTEGVHNETNGILKEAELLTRKRTLLDIEDMKDQTVAFHYGTSPNFLFVEKNQKETMKVDRKKFLNAIGILNGVFVFGLSTGKCYQKQRGLGAGKVFKILLSLHSFVVIYRDFSPTNASLCLRREKQS